MARRKSTLIKILSGAYPRESGQIFVKGEEAQIANPRDAKGYGIETIYQTLALADNVDAGGEFVFGARDINAVWDAGRYGYGGERAGGYGAIKPQFPKV